MRIEKASLEHSQAFNLYVSKCLQDGIDLYQNAAGDSLAYLQKRIAYAKGKELPEGWPPISMYFYIKGGLILGAIRVRHGSNPYFDNVIGHIGYETVSHARGQGVASAMLTWVMRHVVEQNCIVTCDIDNIASQRVIEKCGGSFLNRFYSEEDNGEVMRYQLQREK